MHHVFLKIYFLLFSLWIHDITADDVVITADRACDVGFSIGTNNHAECRLTYWKTKETLIYNCEYSSCWAGPHQWVPMSGCTRESDKHVSAQQCAQYKYTGQKNVYTCDNPGGVSYTCTYDPSTAPVMACLKCKPKH
ncbi:uncharacterized protein MELLADRAFT_123756 [Melampsora larici-populina 98AG31]|uniref:Secreted protein n=1 Tax=Melampsora larici-populina (strain 98AG31 / pathotype 3-4-7) TaxID=747676 RepID=F4S377_MELLP|nr:uncharacterized protein MELLADRAFT_123756 [Melampsora larici-populina 98AG31]EGG00934.1 secreted protein [Melampsora larici-populina 98AG31]